MSKPAEYILSILVGDTHSNGGPRFAMSNVAEDDVQFPKQYAELARRGHVEWVPGQYVEVTAAGFAHMGTPEAQRLARGTDGEW